METVRIYRLKDLDKRTRARMLAAQMEAARVWMYCVQRHHAARTEGGSWPGRDDLQRETKGGKFALHSQSIQMVCHQFLANVETIKQLRAGNPRHHYPYHPKKYMTVQWPAQAVCRQGRRLILPMGRGRKSFSFHLPDLPEQSSCPGVRHVSATSRAGPLGERSQTRRDRLEAHPLRGDGSVTKNFMPTLLRLQKTAQKAPAFQAGDEWAFLSTAGNVSAETIQRYIERQSGI